MQPYIRPSKWTTIGIFLWHRIIRSICLRFTYKVEEKTLVFIFTVIILRIFTRSLNARLSLALSITGQLCGFAYTSHYSIADRRRVLTFALPLTLDSQPFRMGRLLSLLGLLPLLLSDDYLPYSVVIKNNQGDVWYILAQRVCNIWHYSYY